MEELNLAKLLTTHAYTYSSLSQRLSADSNGTNVAARQLVSHCRRQETHCIPTMSSANLLISRMKG